MGKAARRKKDRRERKLLQSERAKEGEIRGCLVCRRTDGGFESIEHIVPESLGNDTLMLHNGVVCDRCNNGVLAKLDRALCEFKPLSVMRTILGIETKRGKIPSTKTLHGSIQNEGRSTVKVTENGNGTMVRQLTKGGITTGLDLAIEGGPKLTPTYGALLSRSLLKIGLELMWLKGETALDPDFDHVRQAILGDPFSSRLVLPKPGKPNQQFEFHYLVVRSAIDDRLALAIDGDIFGFRLSTSSLPLGSEPCSTDTQLVIDF